MSSYKIFKPQTNFALKADLTKKFDKKMTQDFYFKQLQLHSNKPTYTIIDGPPYANGHIHLGHMVNKIQKDLFNQLYFLLGHKVIYVPGSDCHGLPIEKNIENELKAELKDPDFNIKKIDPLLIRNRCKEFANKWIKTQSEEFAKLGVFGDWDNNFTTMQAALSIVKKLHSFARKGLIYKGVKPVMWSIAEQTSMATAEVEYKDHESTSVDVGFAIKQSAFLDADVKIVIWTTTPWTLPANRAIAYNAKLEYCLIAHNNQKFCVAANLLDSFIKRTGFSEYVIIKKFFGDKLEGTVCHHPLAGKGYEFNVPLLAADHVTSTDGTGFVHTAPAHGEEDFALGVKHNLEITDMVSPNGTFQNVPLFSGLSFKDAAKSILDQMQNSVLSCNIIKHSYPYSWRSHTPLIYRVTPQWYLKLDHVRDIVLRYSDQIKWVPESSQVRFESMLKDRKDWCISRQRAWGVPIILFTQNDCAVLDVQLLDAAYDYVSKHGIDSWYCAAVIDIVGPALFAKYENLEKVLDVLDVWFDAGTMQYSLQNSDNPVHRTVPFPADLYLEGSDQHRGFFQACAVINTIIDDKEQLQAPAKAILTHGFILDAKGHKMSKSLGNVVTPSQLLDKYGVDVLRLWVALTDCTNDIIYSQAQMDKVLKMHDKFRNTIRYCLSTIHDVEEASIDDFQAVELCIYNKLLSFNTKLIEAAHKYQMRTFYDELYHFCNEDLSSFVFDINKDIIYCNKLNDKRRNTILTLYKMIARFLIIWLSPVLKMTCLEAWNAYTNDERECIFTQTLTQLPEPNNEYIALWDKLVTLRSDSNKVIESSLRVTELIKQTGESELHIELNDAEYAYLEKYIQADLSQFIQYLTMTGKVHVHITQSKTMITAVKYDGLKCARCRLWYEEIQDDLCSRCAVCEKSLM